MPWTTPPCKGRKSFCNVLGPIDRNILPTVSQAPGLPFQSGAMKSAHGHSCARLSLKVRPRARRRQRPSDAEACYATQAKLCCPTEKRHWRGFVRRQKTGECSLHSIISSQIRRIAMCHETWQTPFVSRICTGMPPSSCRNNQQTLALDPFARPNFQRCLRNPDLVAIHALQPDSLLMDKQRIAPARTRRAASLHGCSPIVSPYTGADSQCSVPARSALLPIPCAGRPCSLPRSRPAKPPCGLNDWRSAC